MKAESYSPPPPSSALSKSDWQLLITLTVIQFTHVMDFMVLMPLGPQLMRLMGMTPTQFSHVVSAYPVAAGTSGILGAFFLDRFERKRALLLIYSGFILGTLACALAPTYQFLVFARTLTGIFGGVQGALVLAILSDVIAPHKRGRALGITMTSFSLAAVIGIPVGLALANAFSWHAPFLLISGLGIPTIGMMFFFVPRVNQHLSVKAAEDTMWRLIKNLRHDRSQFFALILLPVLLFGHFAVIPFLSSYLVFNVGLSQANLTLVYFFGGLSTLVSTPLAGRLSDRFGAGRVFTATVLFAIIPILLMTNLPPVPLWLALILTSLLFVVSSSRMVPAMTITTGAVTPNLRGGFMSLSGSLQQIGMGLASSIAGMILTQNADESFTHFERVGFISVAFSVLCLFMVRKIRR